jgi:hypothetical protein
MVPRMRGSRAVPWECPKRFSPIRMQDYMRVLYPIEPYRCRVCELTLVVHKASRLIAAPKKTPTMSPRAAPAMT